MWGWAFGWGMLQWPSVIAIQSKCIFLHGASGEFHGNVVGVIVSGKDMLHKKAT